MNSVFSVRGRFSHIQLHGLLLFGNGKGAGAFVSVCPSPASLGSPLKSTWGHILQCNCHSAFAPNPKFC